MKGISKAAHAGLSPLIPAVLAPPEVLAQAARVLFRHRSTPPGRGSKRRSWRLASMACFPASRQWTTVALWWASMASS